MTDKPAENPSSAHGHTERQHVETYPSEGVAPEMVDHPTIKPEPGGHTQSDDVDAGLVAMVGAAAVLLMVIVVVLVEAWYYNWAETERAAKAQTPLELISMREDQEAQLHGYRWINEPQKVVQVDIDEAINRVVVEANKK